MGDLKEN